MLVLTLAGCNSAKKAEEEYNFVLMSNAGRAAECEAAAKVAEAYLKERDSENYRLWNAMTGTLCT